MQDQTLRGSWTPDILAEQWKLEVCTWNQRANDTHAGSRKES